MSLNKNESVFTYTKEYPVASSVIDSVYYDENAREVLLDVDNSLYLYSGVATEDVEALVDANSVGAYYNREWKGRFPSYYAGNWSGVSYQHVPVKQYGPSLSFPSATVNSPVKGDVVVHFLLNGGKEYEFHASTTDSISTAINELNEWTKKVGATASPTKVVFELV